MIISKKVFLILCMVVLAVALSASVLSATGRTRTMDQTLTGTYRALDQSHGLFDVTLRGSPVLAVEIDIKPGSDPNSINCRNENEMIAVAVLTTEVFDAADLDHSTVIFEGAGENHMDMTSGQPLRHEEDVDHDGDSDLVFHFRSGETSLTCASTVGVLAGETWDGTAIEGSGLVRMVES
jgi:hypothetical protein